MAVDLIEHLKRIPLFTSIADGDLKLIAEKFEAASYQPGQIIIKEGEEGRHLYVILEGQVRVVAAIDDNESEITLSFLNAGDYFGEMALITGEPRSATVVAETATKTLTLNKKDFDYIILKNPQVTLSITHILSQRLKNANKARKNAEISYLQRIAPRGSINEFNVINLMKFCEENSLNGELIIDHGEAQARFLYQKGQLENLSLGDLKEEEVMDQVLSWESGDFIIEPHLLEVEKTGDVPEPAPKFLLQNQEAFRHYIEEKLASFISIAGVRLTQSAINKAYHKFAQFFPAARDLSLKITPDIMVSFRENLNWSDKHTLFIAVLFQDLQSSLSRDLIGAEFWNSASAVPEVNNSLEENQYFTYYREAIEIIRA
jgi:CRP-like cAMP-binding protein